MVSFSLSLSGSSSFSRSAVFVSSVRWCPSSRSIFVVSTCGSSFVCRVRGADRVPARALWRALVAARDSGSSVLLGFAGSWSSPNASCSFGSGAFWFDAVSVVASVKSRFVCDALESSPRVVIAPRLDDWEYYGHSSPDTYVEGEGCGVVGCCV